MSQNEKKYIKKSSSLALVFFIAVFFILLNVWVRPIYAQVVFPDGTLIKATDDPRIYVILNNRKRHIPNEAVFNSYEWSAKQTQIADSKVIAGIPNTRVIKTSASSLVFDVTNGNRVAIQTAEEFLASGFSFDEIAIVNQNELESYGLEGAGVSSGGQSVSQSILFQKIKQARALLASAEPLYPQEKRISNTRNLTQGTTGSDVELVQKKLQELGYFPASTKTNGVFGPKTLRAVKVFQAAQGISQTGTVGPQTKSALERRGLEFPSAGSLMAQWRDEVPADRDVLLALWNEKTDDTQLVRVTLKSRRVNSARTSLSVVTRTQGFSIKYKNGNGVNVQYTVASPVGYQVLANRFPIFDETTGELGSWPPAEEVYVPYSDLFRTPEIVASGREYLDATVRMAIEDLRERGVRSATGNGLVADSADSDELKNIAIIEHIDHSEFRNTADKQGVVNKVFTILGTNREEAYRFAGSSKGALGLAQFMEKTYHNIRARFPSAGLIPDFESGMTNHMNAFKAMALYNDTTNSALLNYAREKITSDPNEFVAIMAEVRAAAYNGGSSRVKNAIKKFGNEWYAASSSRYGLRAETKTYLEKFRAVRQVLAMR